MSGITYFPATSFSIRKFAGNGPLNSQFGNMKRLLCDSCKLKTDATSVGLTKNTQALGQILIDLGTVTLIFICLKCPSFTGLHVRILIKGVTL